MLREARLLFAASEPQTSHEELRRAVLDENALMARSAVNRRELLLRLSLLYGLRPELPVYRALRRLWPVDERDEPLLALLCALARDPLLRATAGAVLAAGHGAPVAPSVLESAVETAFPARYSAVVRPAIARHAMSTWAQAGLLRGRAGKIRSRPSCGPAAATYALYLGWLCGARGLALFRTAWVETLDQPPGGVERLAAAAGQLGLIEHRRLGSVVEITFRSLEAA